MTVGLVAGSGATYAFTSDPTRTGSGTDGQHMRGYGFPGDGGFGGPPGSSDRTGGAPTETQQETSADGESV